MSGLPFTAAVKRRVSFTVSDGKQKYTSRSSTFLVQYWREYNTSQCTHNTKNLQITRQNMSSLKFVHKISLKYYRWRRLHLVTRKMINCYFKIILTFCFNKRACWLSCKKSNRREWKECLHVMMLVLILYYFICYEEVDEMLLFLSGSSTL